MLYIANDHAGYKLKTEIIKYLDKKNIIYEDLGCDSIESVDYPDFAKKLSEKVLQNDKNKGILICGTGIGMSIVANRYKNIRAGLCKNVKTTLLARQHNDINILVLEGRTKNYFIKKMIEVFLSTDALDGRHKLRRDKID